MVRVGCTYRWCDVLTRWSETIRYSYPLSCILLFHFEINSCVKVNAIYSSVLKMLLFLIIHINLFHKRQCLLAVYVVDGCLNEHSALQVGGGSTLHLLLHLPDGQLLQACGHGALDHQIIYHGAETWAVGGGGYWLRMLELSEHMIYYWN